MTNQITIANKLIKLTDDEEEALKRSMQLVQEEWTELKHIEQLLIGMKEKEEKIKRKLAGKEPGTGLRYPGYPYIRFEEWLPLGKDHENLKALIKKLKSQGISKKVIRPLSKRDRAVDRLYKKLTKQRFWQIGP